MKFIYFSNALLAAASVAFCLYPSAQLGSPPLTDGHARAPHSLRTEGRALNEELTAIRSELAAIRTQNEDLAAFGSLIIRNLHSSLSNDAVGDAVEYERKNEEERRLLRSDKNYFHSIKHLLVLEQYEFHLLGSRGRARSVSNLNRATGGDIALVEPLFGGWIQVTDTSGRGFYFDSTTGEVALDRPKPASVSRVGSSPNQGDAVSIGKYSVRIGYSLS